MSETKLEVKTVGLSENISLTSEIGKCSEIGKVGISLASEISLS